MQVIKDSVAGAERRIVATTNGLKEAVDRKIQSQSEDFRNRVQSIDLTVKEAFDSDLHTQFLELSAKVEELTSIREGREEETLAILNKLSRLESRDEQLEKLKYFISMLQKDHSARIARIEAKVETDETAKVRSQRQLESRLSAIEESSRSIGGDQRDQSVISTPQLSMRNSQSRNSQASIPQVSRLEERVADLEKELNNVAYVKKRLIETMVITPQKRVKTLEKKAEEKLQEHVCQSERESPHTDHYKSRRSLRESEPSKTPVRTEEEGISARVETRERAEKAVVTEPIASESSPTQPMAPLDPQPTFSPASNPMFAKLSPDQAPLDLNDRIAKLEKLEIHKKALRSVDDSQGLFEALHSDKGLPMNVAELRKSEKGGNGFLPGEAESVVMSALLERSQRGKSSIAESVKLGFVPAYRSLSPLSGSFISLANYSHGSVSEPQQLPDDIATKEIPDRPSTELQEYLRMKGFRFPEPLMRK